MAAIGSAPLRFSRNYLDNYLGLCYNDRKYYGDPPSGIGKDFFMKYIKGLSLLLCLLLALTAVFTACDSKTPTADTTASDTTASTEAPTNAPDETTTEAPTEGETEAPVDLSADELKALLDAALHLNTENAQISIQAAMGGEKYSDQIIRVIGNDFLMEGDIMGFKTKIIALGEQVYYYVSMDDGETVTEMRYVLTPSAEDREELYTSVILANSTAELEGEMATMLLNSTMAGKKHADGSVEMTCTELSSDLIALLMGESLEGATLSFDFTLDAEGRMTLMRSTIDVPAELTGGEPMSVVSETAINYSPAPITAPADADQYVTSTYDELFGIVLPDPDYEEAAGLGLPVDGDKYTVGGENPANDPEEQMYFLYLYAHCYEDKTFTVYGNLIETDDGNLAVSLGEDMEFIVYFGQSKAPAVGSYVKVTATFTRTVDLGDYVDFDCFTLIVSSCDVLGEAQGPNGGKLMYVTASSLNVRSAPDSSVDNRVGLLYTGDMVEVLETNLGNGTWCKIAFDCDAGYAYVSMNYLSEQKP